MIAGSDLEMFERSLRQATSRSRGAELDTALAEIGWPDALEVDRQAAVSILFPLLGSTNATCGALERVVSAALGPAVETGATDGERAAVVLPALGSWAPPGRLHAGRLDVRGLGLPALRDSDTVVVAAVVDAGGSTALFRVQRDELDLRDVHGIDPDFGLVEITGKSAAAEELAPAGVTDWTGAVSLARMAVAHELVGASRAMLELARQHALDRVQFGQPIARFQAVRHRLAETLVAVETADSFLAAAWEDPSPELSGMAKALAGRGARTSSRHCQQVLAGIGFTAEHPFHGYLRRVLLLDQLFGSAAAVTADLGRRLLDSRRLPNLLPL